LLHQGICNLLERGVLYSLHLDIAPSNPFNTTAAGNHFDSATFPFIYAFAFTITSAFTCSCSCPYDAIQRQRRPSHSSTR
jgi:hypothetical protein